MSFVNNDLETPISNIFIDKYMKDANGTFVKIYLYGYKNFYHRLSDLTSKDISQSLDILESDIILAWKYWEKQGLLNLYYNEHSNTYTVKYLSINEPLQQPAIQAEANKSPKNKFNIIATKPQYSPQEISIYKQSNEEIKDLFSYAQKTLGKLLTYPDMNVIFSFYDWLRLPIDVIKVLLAYYSDKSMNYIEKVAIDWAESGIDTIDKAEIKMQLYSQYTEILKSFGITGNRLIIEKEKEYIDKWLNVYKFSIEIIKEACSKTVINTGNISFGYADSILEDWFKNNIKNLEDIKKLEEAFVQKKKLKAENRLSNNKSQPKVNRFVNYDQGDWDFDKLDKLEKAYINKHLEE